MLPSSVPSLPGKCGPYPEEEEEEEEEERGTKKRNIMMIIIMIVVAIFELLKSLLLTIPQVCVLYKMMVTMIRLLPTTLGAELADPAEHAEAAAAAAAPVYSRRSAWSSSSSPRSATRRQQWSWWLSVLAKISRSRYRV